MYLAHGVARRDAEPHGKSRGLQRAGDGVLRQLGRVVLLGKVREQDVARAALHGEPRKFRRRVVGQMPLVAEDAALEEIGVGAVLQRFHVVIGFEQERIHARERFTRRAGDEAGVSQDAERAVGGVDAVADGIHGVVRGGERAHGAACEFKRVACGEGDDGTGEDMGYAARDIDRGSAFFAECGEAADVVGVLVRDEYGGQVAERPPQRAEGLLDAAAGDARVDEQQRVARAHERAVAARTAGKRVKFHGKRSFI